MYILSPIVLDHKWGLFDRTLDLKRVHSTDRSTQSCEGPKAWWSPRPQAIKVLIHTEVHIMRGPIALDGVLDLKWPKYSLNLEVLSCEGPKARWSSWPQVIKVLVYIEVQSQEGPLYSMEYSTSSDQGTR
jgi:hypothetical protein